MLLTKILCSIQLNSIVLVWYWHWHSSIPFPYFLQQQKSFKDSINFNFVIFDVWKIWDPWKAGVHYKQLSIVLCGLVLLSLSLLQLLLTHFIPPFLPRPFNFNFGLGTSFIILPYISRAKNGRMKGVKFTNYKMKWDAIRTPYQNQSCVVKRVILTSL